MDSLRSGQFTLGHIFAMFTGLSIVIIFAKQLHDLTEFLRFVGSYFSFIWPLFVVAIPMFFARWIRTRRRCNQVRLDREMILARARARAAE